MTIKNIIFDLGGVLMDISFAKTRDAFMQSGVSNFDDYFQQSHSNQLFLDLETGRITPAKFYEKFRTDSGTMLSDDTIMGNWNALLGSFRVQSIDMLSTLKEKYKLFLFSNTNLIHYEAFIQSYTIQFGHKNFNELFDKAYYSHDMNQRKPDPASFSYIILENNLLAGETLFIDDSYVNIEGAQKAGLQTLWLQNGMLIENVLPAVLQAEQ
jgi:FMN phosphatase YigB (HAD superfamily)